MESETKIGKRLASGQVNQLKDAIKLLLSVMGYVGYEDNVDRLLNEVEDENNQKNFDNENNLDCTGFKVFEADNDAYLLTWTTNSYQDREGEFFTLQAIEDYVARNVDNERKGTHQFWHVPGSDFTDIVAQLVSGKFLAEIGKFRNNEIGQGFKNFFLQYPESHPLIAPDGWGCSHGFVYKREDRQDGVYEWFDKKESTILPLHEAANIFTVMQVFDGEKSMQLSDKQVAAFEEVGKAVKQPNLLQRILSLGQKRTEVLDAAGFESKAVVLKTEDGYEYPEKCFLYVPDSEQVSTWKLRICAPETTEVTREQLGAAAAAFSEGGFRGNQVELPTADVAKVKAKLRAEYEKLGVKEEDMPEGIKEAQTVKALQEKFAETVKACATDLRKKMEDTLTVMEKEDADKVEMLRQLAELVAQVQEAELRSALTEIVTAMQVMLKPEEEESMDVPVEVDAAMVEEIVKALKLDSLSNLLEVQQKAIDENTKVAKVVETMADVVKDLIEKQQGLLNEVAALKKDLSVVKKADEIKVAEKQARFSPFWGSQFQASKAAETVLTEEKANEYRNPEVPSVIQNISKKIMGGK